MGVLILIGLGVEQIATVCGIPAEEFNVHEFVGACPIAAMSLSSAACRSSDMLLSVDVASS